MKKRNLLPWITSIVVLVVLVICGNMSPIGIAATVFISIFFFHAEKNIERKSSKEAGYLIPHGNRLPLYILGLGLMVTYVLSKPFNVGVVKDVYYALFWGIYMGLLFIKSFEYWVNANCWDTTKKIGGGTLHSPQNDKTKKDLIVLYTIELIIVSSFIVISFFGELEVASILIITNQLFVTFLPRE